MNILVTLDDNYVRPLEIMLDSLFLHETEPIDLYLFYSNISETNLQRIRKQIEEHGNRFFPVFVEDDVFRDAPVLDYFPKEMYYRLLCTRLLPKDMERALYMDPDLIIRGSLVPLYNMDFQGKQMIAVSDYGVNHFQPQKKTVLGMTMDEIYVNSGVLLFNLPLMREKFVLADYLRLLYENQDILSYPDQDIINLYFRGEIGYADKIYNYNTGYHTVERMIAYLFKGNRPNPEPVVAHYMGPFKPWSVVYYLKYTREYMKYLRPRLSPGEKVLFFFKPVFVFGMLVRQFVFYLLGLIYKAITGKEWVR